MTESQLAIHVPVEVLAPTIDLTDLLAKRSEERRVGKEC